MVRCWNVNPDFRPPFENLRKRMESYIRDTVCNNDLDNKILVSDLSIHAFCSSDSPLCNILVIFKLIY